MGSVLLAYVIGLLFFKDSGLTKVLALALIMLILSYVFEYTKKRDREKGP